MTTITRLSSKGQVVLPKEIRERHGWEPGLEMEVEDLGHSIVLRPIEEVPETSFDDLFGCLDYDGPPRSLKDMEKAIAQGILETWGDRSSDRS